MEIVREDTVLNLKPDEGALVLSLDGSMQVVLPKFDEEMELPPHIQFLAAIAIIAKKDEEFIDDVLNKFYTLLEESTDWKPSVQPDPIDTVKTSDEIQPGDIGC
jgi:hypothetical protein